MVSAQCVLYGPVSFIRLSENVLLLLYVAGQCWESWAVYLRIFLPSMWTVSSPTDVSESHWDQSSETFADFFMVIICDC